MRKFCFMRQRRAAVLCCLVAVVLLFGAGMALASSEGHGEHGEAGSSKMPDFIYRIVNFSVLVGGLYFALRKPLAKAFANRTKGIADKLAELEQQKADAEKKYAEYSEKLSMLERETADIVQSYIDEGEAAKTQILQDAEKMAATMQEKAKLAIQQEFDMAKARIQEEIISDAVAAAEKKVAAEINSDDQDRLVDEYLAKVVVAQ